ncbi:MAG TPA: hypothetical protein VI636_00880 [Candidatus Angelobacter sp.]
MSNRWEIAGSCMTVLGAGWLSVEAFLIRNRIREEAGAAELLEIVKKANAEEVLTTKDGRTLKSQEALRLWLAGRTIAWNWVGLGLIAIGFVLDLIGKFKSL